jgi:hypothetical protein
VALRSAADLAATAATEADTAVDLAEAALDAATVTINVTGTGSEQNITLSEQQVLALGEGTVNVSAKQVDQAGNLQAAGSVSVLKSFEIDLTDPEAVGGASAVVATPGSLSDTNEAGTMSVTVTFGEAMDETVEPTLTLSPDVSSSLDLDEELSGWTSSTEYVAVYTVADAGVDVDAVSVGVSGARDVAGNPMAAYTADVEFSIDTRNPSVVALTEDNTDGVVSDADQTVTYTVTFSEAVQGLTAGDIAVTGGAVVDDSITLEENKLSATFQVKAADNSTDDLVVSINDTVKDQAGNVLDTSKGVAVVTLDVDTENPDAPILVNEDEDGVSVNDLDTSAAFSFNAEPGSDVTLELKGSKYTEAYSNLAGEKAEESAKEAAVNAAETLQKTYDELVSSTSTAQTNFFATGGAGEEFADAAALEAAVNEAETLQATYDELVLSTSTAQTDFFATDGAGVEFADAAALIGAAQTLVDAYAGAADKAQYLLDNGYADEAELDTEVLRLQGLESDYAALADGLVNFFVDGAGSVAGYADEAELDAEVIRLKGLESDYAALADGLVNFFVDGAGFVAGYADEAELDAQVISAGHELAIAQTAVADAQAAVQAATVTITDTGAGGPVDVVLTAAQAAALGEGVVTVAATQTDASGNPSEGDPTVKTFTIDLTPPNVVSVTTERTSVVTDADAGTGGAAGPVSGAGAVWGLQPVHTELSGSHANLTAADFEASWGTVRSVTSREDGPNSDPSVPSREWILWIEPNEGESYVDGGISASQGSPVTGQIYGWELDFIAVGSSIEQHVITATVDGVVEVLPEGGTYGAKGVVIVQDMDGNVLNHRGLYKYGEGQWGNSTILVDAEVGQQYLVSVGLHAHYETGDGLYALTSDQDAVTNGLAYISDGGDDIYDDGNYLSNSANSELFYSTTPVADKFGLGSEYVTSYEGGVFATFVTGNLDDEFSVTGETGADGDGSEVIAHLQDYNGYSAVVFQTMEGWGDPTTNRVLVYKSTASAVVDSLDNDTDSEDWYVSGLSRSDELAYFVLWGANTNSALSVDSLQAFMEAMVDGPMAATTAADKAAAFALDVTSITDAIDWTLPIPKVEFAGADVVPLTASVTYTVTFDEDVSTTLYEGDFTVTNGHVESVSVDGSVATVVVRVDDGVEGNVGLSVKGSAIDVAGNFLANADGTEASNDLVLIDTANPALVSAVTTFTGVATDATSNVTYTLTFSEDVQALTAEDVKVINGTVESVTTTGDTAVVVVTPDDDVDGKITVRVYDTILDLNGNVIDDLGSPNALVDIDTRNPVVVSSSAVVTGGVDASEGKVNDDTTSVTYTVTFSEAIDNSTEDLTALFSADNGTVSSVSVDGAVATVVVTPDDNVEDQIALYVSGQLLDLNDNAYLADDPEVAIDKSVSIDTINPMASFDPVQTTKAYEGDLSVSYTINFTQPVAALSVSDLALTGGDVTVDGVNIPAVITNLTMGPDGSSASFDVEVRVGSTNPLQVTLNDTVRDLAGNKLAGAVSADEVGVDALDPSVAFTGVGVAGKVSSITEGGLVVTGTAEVGSGEVSVTYRAAATDDKVSLGKAVVGADGTWSLELTSEALNSIGYGDGKKLAASQTDDAGNTFEIHSPVFFNQVFDGGSLSSSVSDAPIEDPILDLSNLEGGVAYSAESGLVKTGPGGVVGYVSTEGYANDGGYTTVFTGSGDDMVIGGDRDEVFDVGTGNDYLHGGAGIDTADFSRSAGTEQGPSGQDADRVATSAGSARTLSAANLTIQSGDLAVLQIAGRSIVAQVESSMTLAAMVGALSAQMVAAQNHPTSLAETREALKGLTVSYDETNQTVEFGGPLGADADVSLQVLSFGGALVNLGERVISTDEHGNVIESAAAVRVDGSFTEITDIENVLGTAYSDILVGDDASNVIVGNAGDDYLVGAGGDDEISGGSGDDYLVGAGGDDEISGGSGSNIMLGGENQVMVSEVTGEVVLNDIYYGGNGRDTFVISIGEGNVNSIRDFDVSGLLTSDVARVGEHTLDKIRFDFTAEELAAKVPEGTDLSGEINYSFSMRPLEVPLIAGGVSWVLELTIADEVVSTVNLDWERDPFASLSGEFTFSSIDLGVGSFSFVDGVASLSAAVELERERVLDTTSVEAIVGAATGDIFTVTDADNLMVGGLGSDRYEARIQGQPLNDSWGTQTINEMGRSRGGYEEDAILIEGVRDLGDLTFTRDTLAAEADGRSMGIHFDQHRANGADFASGTINVFNQFSLSQANVYKVEKIQIGQEFSDPFEALVKTYYFGDVTGTTEGGDRIEARADRDSILIGTQSTTYSEADVAQAWAELALEGTVKVAEVRYTSDDVAAAAAAAGIVLGAVKVEETRFTLDDVKDAAYRAGVELDGVKVAQETNTLDDVRAAALFDGIEEGVAYEMEEGIFVTPTLTDVRQAAFERGVVEGGVKTEEVLYTISDVIAAATAAGVVEGAVDQALDLYSTDDVIAAATAAGVTENEIVVAQELYTSDDMVAEVASRLGIVAGSADVEGDEFRIEGPTSASAREEVVSDGQSFVIQRDEQDVWIYGMDDGDTVVIDGPMTNWGLPAEAEEVTLEDGGTAQKVQLTNNAGTAGDTSDDLVLNLFFADGGNVDSATLLDRIKWES